MAGKFRDFNQLNNSNSKQSWSIPKSNRFGGFGSYASQIIGSPASNAYSNKSQFDHIRGKAVGVSRDQASFGNYQYINSNSAFVSPASYKEQSGFGLNKGPGFAQKSGPSIGLSRSNVINGDYIDGINKKGPGPNEYKKTDAANNSIFTNQQRRIEFNENRFKSNANGVPGPSDYNRYSNFNW